MENRWPARKFAPERLDAKASVALTRTDAKGRYSFDHLAAGAYGLTASVQGVPKSRANVRTRSDGWARVDFDLRKAVSGKGVTGKPSATAGTTPPPDDLGRIQRSLGGNINGMSFPGH
jgi:hypothetical protein